jgi:hypothetical protein
VTLYGSARLGEYRPNEQDVKTPKSTGSLPAIADGLLFKRRGYVHYELTNHLGNVLATVSDRKLAFQNGELFYRSDIESLTDYYAFGMTMPDRAFNADAYRYSINGQEKDTDIDASGNHTTALYWEYDSRTGRRWNSDPIVKVWESPYACFGDNPIYYNDPDGADWGIKKTEKDGKTIYDIKITGAVYNNSGKEIDMEALKTKMIAQVKDVYGSAADPNTQVNVQVNLRVVNNLKDVGTKDHLISIESDANYDKYAGSEGKGTNGYADMGGLKIIIPYRTANGILKDQKDYHRTIAHELGHTGGLHHPSSSNSSTVDGVNKYDTNDKNNFMYEKGGKNANANQIKVIYENYTNQRINQQTQFIHERQYIVFPSNKIAEPRQIDYGIQTHMDWKDYF